MDPSNKVDIFIEKNELNECKFDFILDSIQYSLANPVSIKCLTEDDLSQIKYTQCWSQILNELIYSNRTKTDGFVIFFQNIINSYHNLHICSCKTAICFSLLLWKHLKSNITKNDMISKQISFQMSSVLNECIDLVKKNKLLHLNNQQQEIKLKSRHIIKKIDYSSFKSIINGVCRNQSNLSDIVNELISEHQLQNKEFNFDNISILTSKKNNAFNFKIINGIVHLLDSINSNIINTSTLNINDRSLNSILIDSSLVHNYSFLGFNKNLESIQFDQDYTLITSQLELWRIETKSILIENNIKVLFIKDKIDDDLMNFCILNSILVFKNLSNDFFKQLMILYNCKPIVYINNLVKEENIFISKFKQIDDYLIFDNFNTDLFTVIIESNLIGGLLKENLKHCLKRTQNILKSNIFLNGNGNTEKYLYNELNTQISRYDLNDHKLIYFNIVKDVFMKTFRDFSFLVANNDALSMNTYDDFSSKIEAWKIACLINKFFLNTDFSLRI
jgi:hypothetical protein